MTDLFDAIQDTLAKDASRPWIHPSPICLMEDAKKNKCPPTDIQCATRHFALRLYDDTRLKCLTAGYGHLPDYIVFSESRPARKRPSEPALQVLLCELKSGPTGVREAERQLQLGRLLCEYLLRIAAYSRGQTQIPKADYRCMVVSRELPPSPELPKGRCDPRREEPDRFDSIYGMPIYHRVGGCVIHLENLFT